MKTHQINEMTFDDIYKVPLYQIYNLSVSDLTANVMPKNITFDVEIKEGDYKGTVINFKNNDLTQNDFRVSYKKVLYKNGDTSLKLYEKILNVISGNILLDTIQLWSTEGFDS